MNPNNLHQDQTAPTFNPSTPHGDFSTSDSINTPTSNTSSSASHIESIHTLKNTEVANAAQTYYKNYCVWCGALYVYNGATTFIKCPICFSLNAVDVESHVPYNNPTTEQLDLVSQCKQWSSSQVSYFLRSLHCDNNTVAGIAAHSIDGSQLLHISASDLIQIGIKNEEQITKILTAIAKIKENAIISAFSSHYETTSIPLQLQSPPLNTPLPSELVTSAAVSPDSMRSFMQHIYHQMQQFQQQQPAPQQNQQYHI